MYKEIVITIIVLVLIIIGNIITRNEQTFRYFKTTNRKQKLG